MLITFSENERTHAGRIRNTHRRAVLLRRALLQQIYPEREYALPAHIAEEK